MSRFKKGVYWTVIVTIIGLPFFITAYSMLTDIKKYPQWFESLTTAVLPFLIFLELAGIFMILTGFHQMKVDKEIEMYGEPTYGKIIDITETGLYVCDKPELTAKILVYIPVEDNIQVFNKVIGFPPVPYQMKDYIKVLYSDDDIKIVETIDVGSVPKDKFDFIEEANKKIR